MNRLLEFFFDVFYEGSQIGGASAIKIRGSTHILTAHHVSHDKKNSNAPRALILRNRSGTQTFLNITFHKIRGSADLAISTPVSMTDGFSVATTYTPNENLITTGTPLSLTTESRVHTNKSTALPIPLKQAPKYIALESKNQQIAPGFSGKPILNVQEQIIAVITRGRPRRTKTTGLAETLRLPIFR